MNLVDLELQLGLSFPPRHREALLNPEDPIRKVCDFLVVDSPQELGGIIAVNSTLHAPQGLNPWPAFLVAFASNGCADYFAYDLRQNLQVLYIDPDLTVNENLASTDASLTFDTFDRWYEWKLRKTRRSTAVS